MKPSKVTELAADHHEVYTEIVIDVPPHRVWAVVTDFRAMPDWSPSFKGLSGDFSDGGNITTVFDMGEGDEEYTATLHLIEGSEYGWSEDYDGIRDNHIYRVVPLLETQTRFVQTDAFKGTADWATTAELAQMYLEQYEAFNRALKAECERRYASRH